jgi:hypothetical protein
MAHQCLLHGKEQFPLIAMKTTALSCPSRLAYKMTTPGWTLIRSFSQITQIRSPRWQKYCRDSKLKLCCFCIFTQEFISSTWSQNLDPSKSNILKTTRKRYWHVSKCFSFRHSLSDYSCEQENCFYEFDKIISICALCFELW